MKPKMTVVTVTYNAASCLEKTIQSVISQTYANLEYIIIDGGSTDGTIDIIRRYASHLSYWVSERDGGIYFGMNKGIQAATGNYLLFMNADDTFYSNDAVAATAAYIQANQYPDAVYGDVVEQTEYGFFRKRTKDIREMSVHMAIAHQTIFIKTELMRQHPFDTRYRYVADFEMLSYFYNQGYRFAYTGIIVAVMVMMAGTTFSNYVASVNEHYDLLLSRGVNLDKERNSLLFRKKIVRCVKACLPQCIEKPLFQFIAKHYKAL